MAFGIKGYIPEEFDIELIVKLNFEVTSHEEQKR